MLKRPASGGSAHYGFQIPRISVNRISLGMGLCGLIAIVLASGFIAWRERETDMREARAEAQTTAFSLADHASRLFEVANLALRTTELEAGDKSWDEIESSRALWEQMRATADALPYVGDLWLNDSTGRLRVSTAAFPTPASTVKDRPAFQAVAAGEHGLVIGEPFVGRVTQARTFFIARRLDGPDGSFRGMVSVTADPSYFTSYWRSLGLAAGDHVALVRGPEVLVRLPEEPPVAPTSLSALKAATERRSLSGTYRPAPDRFAYYHRVGDLPLYLTVSFSAADVDHLWRTWLWGFLLFPGVAILALAAIMALSRRQSHIEARSTREVIRARGQLAAVNQQLERRVAERTADLQESNAEVQRFAYIVSHDLRAPLLNITGFTSELQAMRGAIFAEPGSDGATPVASLEEDFDEAIGFIQTSIDKMDRLINAILLLARQGSRVFTPEPVEMAALMHSVADGVAHRAQAAGARVTIEEPMPTLTIDRVAAEQVFSNLVDNAVKYLRSDVPGEIVIAAVAEAGRVTVKISDNGRGIAPRDHARVFELFRRSGPQDRAGEGIGLAHVRSLVRQLGGTISLASTLGEGSTFTVVLPLAPEGGPA